jgi:putative ABC transport system permease protein
MNLWKFSIRQTFRRPGRSLLTLLSILMGVAIVIAVGQASRGARSAFDHMNAALTGMADGELVARGGGLYNQQVLHRLDGVSGVKMVVPSLRQPTVILTPDWKRFGLLIVGVDLAREKAVHDYDLMAGRLCAGPGETVLDETLAQEARLRLGDEVRMLSRSGLPKLRVVGLVRLRGLASFLQGSVLFVTLEALQEYTKSREMINFAHVVLESGVRKDLILEEIRRRLTGDIVLRSADVENAGRSVTMVAFQQGLLSCSALGLAASALLILNTFLMNVTERRRQIATLRLLGATRTQIMRLLLREGLLLGLIGAVLGWGFGWVLAQLLSRALRQIFGVPMVEVVWSPWTALLALLLGPGLALAAAYYPGRLAMSIPALEVLRLGQSGTDRRRLWPGYSLLGGALGAAGCVLMALAVAAWIPPNTAIAAAIVLLLALILLFPLGLQPLAGLAAFPLRLLGRVETDLALRQALRHPSRTVLTWSILFVSVAASVCIGVIIVQVVDDVRSWSQHTFNAEFVVRVSMPNLATGAVADMPEDMAGRIAQFRGTKSVEEVTFVTMDSEYGRLLATTREFGLYDSLPLDVVAPPGNPARLRQSLLNGEVMVSDILANKFQIKPGDRITVEFAGRRRSLPVAGTARGYIMGGMSFHMDHRAAQKEFGPLPPAALVITAREGFATQLEQQLRELCRQRGLMFQTHATFETMVQSLLNAVVGSLWGLFALSFLIAAFGITNTLIMNVLEQTRELGLMRVLGMQAGQVRRMILTQALLIGVLGIVPGILVGIVLAGLIRASVVAVLGKTFDLSPALPWLVPYTLVVLLLVVVCGWVPAVRATRLNILECIRAE